jgi:histone-lysine N-methyltransferase SETMAR
MNLLPNNQNYHCTQRRLCSVFGGLRGVSCIANCCQLAKQSVPLVYSEQLERVHEKLKTKEPALVTCKGVVLLHDNAKPHVAKVTHETIIRLGWETLVHPPYYPDIAPSDYHLFHSLDNHLRGRHFRTLDDVKTALDGFFASHSKEFYHIGVHGLPSRWQKVLDGNS